MKAEIIITSVILIVVCLFLINFSIKIFNTMDPWLGIGLGVVSVTAIVYSLVKILIKKMK